ncbi:MAG: peptidoglycan DD-metalloendopeptidase family protein [Desulfovibrio sp.]|jgi:Rod binding domain-containing protein/murein DD-endopeptidase MepM/ murein hydrolase activator NlpD|nr:peptidoglycan DD-metalloendopeptidase family protein [Desulfovibrio sp.]
MTAASAPLDPAFIASENTRKDMVQRKLDMDALRKRLGPDKDKAAELRGACEGFESVFLQKMWEQMRKTVPKEGFLHSKDEETYQSLFDVELCKKMASAGGIGLADMLYQQLSQQLADSGRTTIPGRIRDPLNVPPSKGLLAAPKDGAASALSPDAPGKSTISADDLYAPLPDDNGNADDEDLDSALQSLRTEVDNASAPDARGEALRAADAFPAGDRRIEPAVSAGGAPAPMPHAAAGMPARSGGLAPYAGMPARDGEPAVFTEAAQDLLRTDGGMRPAGPAPTPPEAAYDKETTPGTSVLSWQGPGPVSAKPRPISNFARNRKQPRTGKKNDTQARAAQQAQLQAQAQAQQAQLRAQTQARTPAAPSLVPNPAFTQNAVPQDAAQAQFSASSPTQVMNPAQTTERTQTPAQAQQQSADRTQAAGDALAPPLTQPPAGILNGARKPLPGPVISRFGWEDDGTGRRRWKPGVEIAASPGESVRAVLPGTVVYAGPRDGAGNTVVIEHNDGYRSYYGNLQPTTVHVGQRVGLGAEFAKVAAQPAAQAGGENSASLHFELKKGEMALNPESVFSRAGEARRQDARAG